MQISRGRRAASLLVGLTLTAGAVATASGTVGATTEPPGTEPAGTEAEMTDTSGAPGGSAAPGGEGGTVEAAPTCTGESDGVLHIGTVLPETGSLAFLGPPEFAGAELAINDINAAGGVLGQEVALDQGDSGDGSTPEIAAATVADHLTAGVDVFIGAASSTVSFNFIDTLVENCKVHFSPANTSPDFTTYADDGLYFRTAPSDVLQGRILGELMINDGVTNAVFLALQDPYGDGLLQYSTESFADAGGEVLDAFSYDPNAASFDAEVDRVVSANTEAVVVIGFEETAQILTGLFEAGVTNETHKIYLVDGNVGNALGEQLPAGSMEGIQGTLPAAEITEDFRARMLEVDPELIDYSYGPETYDAVVISALAAAVAGTDDPAQIAANINGVTRDGEKCTTFADCIALIDAGTDIDYDGPSGPQTFGPEGEPTEASFVVLCYDAANKVDGDCAPFYQFAAL